MVGNLGLSESPCEGEFEYLIQVYFKSLSF